MARQISLVQELRFLWVHLELKFKLGFITGIVLSIFSSFAEIVSIGAVAPFITALAYPEKILNFFPWLSDLQIFFGVETLTQIAIFVFMSAIVVAMFFRVFLMIFNAKLSYQLGIHISNLVLKNILYRPYSFHVTHNSSEVLSLVSQKVNAVVGNVFYPLLTFTSSAIMFILTITSLGSLYPKLTIMISTAVIMIYTTIAFLARKALLRNSKIISEHTTNIVKVINESLGGIRDVIIDGTQKTFLNIFFSANSELKTSEARNIYLSQAPKFLIETIGMLAISIASFRYISTGHDFTLLIPILGVIALGAQRMLPILQQAYGSWISMQASLIQLHEVLDASYSTSPERSSIDYFSTKKIDFNEKILIQNLSFRFESNRPLILDDISIEIKKGERVGLIGKTGSGKSTLADILMALLPTNEGDFYVDCQKITLENSANWRLNVAHVPQCIFLSDSSIIENIAFGIPTSEIDVSRVIEAARQAQLIEFIDQLPDGFNTEIGERGVRLSGGQRQRIGIARALYKRAKLIIFDEATSALDDHTEQLIMDTIYHLDDQLTIIIIAHRLTTLRGCNKILQIEKGEIVRTGSYSDIIGTQHKDFLITQ